MQMIKGLFVATCCGAIVMALVGCSSVPKARTEETPISYPVRINVPPFPAPQIGISNRDDLSQYVALGVSLSDAGRNREAANVFLKAAEKFKSEHQRFEQDCCKAAIRCYWLAGDLKNCKKTFQALENYQNDELDSYPLDENTREIKRIIFSYGVMNQ